MKLAEKQFWHMLKNMALKMINIYSSKVETDKEVTKIF